MIMTDNCEDRIAKPRVGFSAGYLTNWCTSFHQWRQESRCSPGPGKSLCPPVPTRQVKPAGSARKRKLSYLIAAQAAHDPFRDVEPPNRIRR